MERGSLDRWESERRTAAWAQECVLADSTSAVAIFRNHCRAVLDGTDDMALDLLRDTVLYKMCISGHFRVKLDTRELKKLLDTNLLTVLRDLVADPKFFRQSEEMTIPVFTVFIAVLRGIYAAKDTSLDRRALDICREQPLANIWHSRKQILNSLRRKVYFENIHILAVYLITTRKNLLDPVRASRAISKQELQVIFFIWHHSADDLERAGSYLAGFLHSVPWHWNDVKRLRKLISSDHELLNLLLEEYGEKAFVIRLLKEIEMRRSESLTERRNLDSPVPWLIVTLDIILFIYRKDGKGVSCNPDLFTNLLLLQHNLDQACMELDFTVHKVIHDCFMIGPSLAWDCALAVLRVIDDEYRSPEGVPGSFVALHSQTLGLMYPAALSACLTDASPAKIEALDQFLREHSSTMASPELRALFKTVVSETSWSEACVRLEDMQRELEGTPSAPVMQSIIAHWTGWGEAVDIDLEAARANLQSRTCSWAECPRHGKPARKALNTCRGCREVRYCSKACQTLDWKRGGHRSACRRLHAP
ncbi:hypothetical protein PENSPDRAFT_650558 [Peniophora sp. CONT]|nr:hypothetical protein PENSPDRAFT_650558 [Peniophora sp. CONT]